jgi:hypothetical protein
MRALRVFEEPLPGGVKFIKVEFHSTPYSSTQPLNLGSLYGHPEAF